MRARHGVICPWTPSTPCAPIQASKNQIALTNPDLIGDRIDGGGARARQRRGPIGRGSKRHGTSWGPGRPGLWPARGSAPPARAGFGASRTPWTPLNPDRPPRRRHPHPKAHPRSVATEHSRVTLHHGRPSWAVGWALLLRWRAKYLLFRAAHRTPGWPI